VLLSFLHLTLFNNRYTFYNRGISRDRAGQYALAIVDFTSAINILPVNADFYHNRGFCHRKKGDLISAIEDYTKVSKER